MRVRSRFKMGQVDSWARIVTIWPLVIVLVILVRFPRVFSQTKHICDTKVSDINNRAPTMTLDPQLIRCESTQPINWTILGLYVPQKAEENATELLFEIETEMAACGSGETSLLLAPAELNSKIQYYFTSTLTPAKRNHSSPEVDVYMFIFFINILCGSFTRQKNSVTFPWITLEFEKNGNFYIQTKDNTQPRSPSYQKKCDVAEFVLDRHESTGTCSCRKPQVFNCKNVIECRFLAHLKAVKPACETDTFQNQCSTTSAHLPNSTKEDGVLLFCESTSQKHTPYISFFPIPQQQQWIDSSVIENKADRNHPKIQILGESAQNYEQFLKLSVSPGDGGNEITRKTGAYIVCKGPAFLFLHGFLWTMSTKLEIKDKEGESDSDPDVLPKFNIYDLKMEDDEKYVSSTLRIWPDMRNSSSVVSVTCQAFVQDRNFFVQSNLTFTFPVYKPKIHFDLECISETELIRSGLLPLVTDNGNTSSDPKGLRYNCVPDPDDYEQQVTVTWQNNMGQKMKNGEGDQSWQISSLTCVENITCILTLANGVENFHTFTRKFCEEFAFKSCPEILDEETYEKLYNIFSTATTTTTTTTRRRTTTTSSTSTPSPTTTTNTITTDASATTALTTPLKPATEGDDKNTDNERVSNRGFEFVKVGLDVGEIVGIVLAVVVFLAAFLFLAYKYLQTRKQLLLLTSNEIDEFVNGDPEKLKNEEIQGENVHLLPFDRKYEVSDSDYSIDQEKILGSGEFGIVYGGTLREISVAIKTTKSTADVEFFKAFLKEIKVMTFIGKHQNVVQLLGTVTNKIRERTVFVIVELGVHGSLHSFLRKHQNNFVATFLSSQLFQISPEETNATEYSNVISTEESTVTTMDLVKWCAQIASGMSHLASKKIIHGDLAARNILLFDDYTAKITDFGLARQLYTSPNYVKKQQSPLPWRIMAPESLKNLEFSTKSDVWSFGALAWEIFSLAAVPYSGLSWTHDFLDRLENDLRLQKPKWATNQIYKNMCDCWHPEPNCRPDFDHLEAFYNEELENCGNEFETVYLELS